MNRIAPTRVDLKLDADQRQVLKNGKPIHICTVCRRETTDIIRVYHGHCHKGFIGSLIKIIRKR